MIGQKRGKTILDSKDCKILAVCIQNNMSWQSHLETGKDALLPQIRKGLGALYHLGKKVLQKSRLSLANGLILRRLLYLIPLWGGASANYVRKVQVVMNSVARWVTGMSKRTRTSTLLTRCKWMSVIELIEYHSILQMWKAIHKMKPRHIVDIIVIGQENILQTAAPRLKFTENCYKWRTIKAWNNMNAELRMNSKISSG